MLNLYSIADAPNFANDTLDLSLAYWLAPRADTNILQLPMPGHCLNQGETEIVWSGSHQWLVMGHNSTTPPEGVDWSLQTDGRVVFVVDLTTARTILPFGCSIDFSDSSFLPGKAVTTQIDHFATLVWRSPSSPSDLRVAVFRSYAESFDQWIETQKSLYSQMETSYV